MLDLVSSNITIIVSFRPARVGRRETMVGVLLLRFGLPVMLQLHGPSVLADWQALVNSSIINPTFIGYEKHLVIGQFSFTLLLLFTGHPSMTPVSFVKTAKSYEVSSVTIHPQISYDSGILRQNYGLIRGLPMNPTRLADWITI